MIMKLIVGRIDEILTELIKSEYPLATLLTEENWQDKVKFGYTGIEEFSNKENFLKLLLSADQIIYFPFDDHTHFDFYNPTDTPRGYTEHFLLLAKQEGIPINSHSFLGESKVSADINQFLRLTDKRKEQAGPQLWCAGCSFTYGSGVPESNRYATILSKKLNLPLNLLALSGTSIDWAADQILRSDIRQDDIVIWGITTRNRITYVKNSKVASFNVSTNISNTTEKALQKLLIDDDFLLRIELTSINQVINFCQKVNAKLLLIGLLASDSDLLYLNAIEEYYHYHYTENKYLDFGSDNEHPGSAQHQKFADKIAQLLHKKGYI